ncbi:hypothetical protein TRFO_29657 [Tritrichomonas foetus]|uniref:EF-hand domain-containing protein n=1 Tax=Tritrichomonas foetus TaxID=1144522 RepID=A0A1J4JV92_9EUKA|nr:hypothetical protein TRFO_29657 [Tritrichomonas foetus]|eukprot:OHT03041.1 hypothetical protein TRFO_29657 [Tritrichomonas foetus]
MSGNRTDLERRLRFEKHWNKIDKGNKGSLNYDQFKNFLRRYNKKEMAEEQNRIYFAGSDVSHSGLIDRDDVFSLVEALYRNDQLYLNKLFFRALDEDGTAKLNKTEFINMAKINGHHLNEEEAEKQIMKLTNGQSNEYLTFPQMHRALTGDENMSSSVDPYDGKLTVHQDYPSDAYFGTNLNKNKNKNRNKKNGKYKKVKSEGESTKHQKSNSTHGAFALSTVVAVIFLITSIIAVAGWVASSAAYFKYYIKIRSTNFGGSAAAQAACGQIPTESLKKQCESQFLLSIASGLHPKDISNTRNVTTNSVYRTKVTPLSLAFMSVVFAALEVALCVFFILQLRKKGEFYHLEGQNADQLQTENVNNGLNGEIDDLDGEKKKVEDIDQNKDQKVNSGSNVRLLVGFCRFARMTMAPVTRGSISLLFAIPTLGSYSILGIVAGMVLAVDGGIILTFGIIDKVTTLRSRRQVVGE